VAIIYRGRLLAEDQMGSLLAGLTKDREIHVDLESLPEELPGAVRELSFVLQANAAGNTLMVKVPKGGDYRKDLSAFLIGRGLVPLAIKEKSLSLEEAFVTITQENVQLFAGMGGRA
jgi:hypothetical protein